MIVVDTSVLIDFFKGAETEATEKLRYLEEESLPYFLAWFCGQELLQGAKDEREWRLLSDYLGGQRFLEVSNGWSSHVDAARIFYDCRREGVTVRSSVDCLIAQLALEHDGTLLHDDEDFERIRKVRPLKTM